MDPNKLPSIDFNKKRTYKKVAEIFEAPTTGVPEVVVQGMKPKNN
jgi:hypothetical protein